VVEYVLTTLNNDPDAYDDNLAEVMQMAKKIGLTIKPDDIPPKTTANKLRALQGPHVSGSTVTVGINCDVANVFDVAGAARLAESLNSPLNLQVTEPTSAAAPIKLAS